jgi:hypothetical protein
MENDAAFNYDACASDGDAVVERLEMDGNRYEIERADGDFWGADAVAYAGCAALGGLAVEARARRRDGARHGGEVVAHEWEFKVAYLAGTDAGDGCVVED